MAKYNVFLFICGVFNASISGALDFFYTAAAPACMPGGPNFSDTYYSAYTALIGPVAQWVGIVGIFLYQQFLSGWTFRYVFWLTAAIRALASLF